MKWLMPALIALLVFLPTEVFAADVPGPKLWEIQSVDTMKYSRDVARIEAENPNFDTQIDIQMAQIADLGATHVGIATPYDDEFVPFLTRWIKSARIHGLKVWFRGNFSGWEGWYGYPSITPSEHIEKTKAFILKNSYLFMDGDIFSPCHECENGGTGDPRQTGKVEEYRNFLMNENKAAIDAFREINKQVFSNYFSMNLDIAKLVMDKKTVHELGSIIVLDHYVATPSALAQDVSDIARVTGAKIVLGEYGAPIPDINGEMTDKQQAEWLTQALDQLVEIPDLIGVNYWVNKGGSTGIFDVSTGQKKPAALVISQYYYPNLVDGYITDTLGQSIPFAKVHYLNRVIAAQTDGHYTVPLMPGHPDLRFVAQGYKDQIKQASTSATVSVSLEPSQPSWLIRLRLFLHLLVLRSHSIIKGL